MHLILADEVSGGLMALAALLGGFLAAGLALCALVPAWQRKRRLTFALLTPACLVVLLATLGIGYGFMTDGRHDPDYSASDFVIPWLIFAGPSLATSFVAIALLAFSSKRSVGANECDRNSHRQ